MKSIDFKLIRRQSLTFVGHCFPVSSIVPGIWVLKYLLKKKEKRKTENFLHERDTFFILSGPSFFKSEISLIIKIHIKLKRLFQQSKQQMIHSYKVGYGPTHILKINPNSILDSLNQNLTANIYYHFH